MSFEQWFGRFGDVNSISVIVKLCSKPRYRLNTVSAHQVHAFWKWDVREGAISWEVVGLSNPPKVTSNRLQSFSMSKNDAVWLWTTRSVYSDHSWFLVVHIFEGWSILMAWDNRSDIDSNNRDCTDNIGGQGMLGIGQDHKMGLSSHIFEPNVALVHHHELVITWEHNDFRNFSQSIRVIDSIIIIEVFLEWWEIKNWKKIDVYIWLECKRESTVSLPHSMEVGSQVGNNWDERSNANNFGAFFTSANSSHKGSPPSLGGSNDYPALDINILDFDHFGKFLNRSHCLEARLSHRKDGNVFWILSWIIDEIVKRPSYQIVFFPWLLLRVIIKYHGTIWNLKKCDSDMMSVISDNISHLDI